MKTLNGMQPARPALTKTQKSESKATRYVHNHFARYGWRPGSGTIPDNADCSTTGSPSLTDGRVR
jgi:hypothetical protein